MQNHAIPCNTMQYHAIQCIINNCWGAYHCPVGSIRPFLTSCLVSIHRHIWNYWNMFQLKIVSAWGAHRPPIWQKSNIATQQTTALVHSCTYFSVDWRTSRWYRWSIHRSKYNWQGSSSFATNYYCPHQKWTSKSSIFQREHIAAKGRPSALLTRLFTTFANDAMWPTHSYKDLVSSDLLLSCIYLVSCTSASRLGRFLIVKLCKI